MVPVGTYRLFRYVVVGRNFMGLTDFFLDYVPMYDKFRAVASILVVAEFTIPLLAMLGLKTVWNNRKY